MQSKGHIKGDHRHVSIGQSRAESYASAFAIHFKDCMAEVQTRPSEMFDPLWRAYRVGLRHENPAIQTWILDEAYDLAKKNLGL
jgi:hypothetical protein